MRKPRVDSRPIDKAPKNKNQRGLATGGWENGISPSGVAAAV
ncbi:hypothetical protein CCACVL1_06884 [Corchorus capsularis]|uniref:Uncharacterized protein n=1 Tax=Corchorus capsularis TaxID=210143 RepID=A0A1R3JBU1_COCAP|nr:hypothetical protein CCACVL1_06884 [Corchorus capsularis]